MRAARRHLVSALIFAAVALALPAHSQDDDRRESLEAQIVSRVARERSDRGLSRLTRDDTLVEAARDHSREMCDKNYFDHRSPTDRFRSPMDRYRQAGGKSRTLSLGENIYYSSRVSAGEAHEALMESPGHRDNILRRGWKRIGVGVYVNEAGEFWVTEMFSD